MLTLVVVVPELGRHEDFLTLHKPFVNGTLDALPGFLLVGIVICTIEQPVASLDRLRNVN